MIHRIACLISYSAALSFVVWFVKTRNSLSYNNVWKDISCLVSAVPKIKVKSLKLFFVFSVQRIVEEKGRSWHILNDLCFIQYSVGLKWFPFACSAQELACSLGTQNSLITMQSLTAAVSKMLKAVAVTSSAAANLWAAEKVMYANVANPGNFIIRLTVFEGFT